jgi:hypothetical protein
MTETTTMDIDLHGLTPAQLHVIAGYLQGKRLLAERVASVAQLELRAGDESVGWWKQNLEKIDARIAELKAGDDAFSDGARFALAE